MGDDGNRVIIFGGTGNQGRRVCLHLLKAGWEVTAFTRNAATERAMFLASRDVQLRIGDPTDRQELREAMRDVRAVVSIQTAEGYPDAGPGFRMQDEVALGSAIAEAAADSGVTHFLYHSVGGAERSSGIRNWEAKWRIEERIRRLGLPATILRPVSFMENYVAPRSGIQSGALRHVLKPDTAEQLIALDDVGAFAAKVLDEPDRFEGAAIEIAGDELKASEIARLLSKASGREIPYECVDVESFTPFIDSKENPHRLDDIRAGARWFNEAGYRADIAACRAMLPTLKTFDHWLRGEGGASLRALLGV